MVENVPPGKTWDALKTNPNAQLVDVRTDAEWNFVGLPDLAALAKQAVLLAWQVYPSMQRNAAALKFLPAMEQKRSGVKVTAAEG